ncbi:hypothetical protein V9T40_000667 [Parthenolecanium corni]|uniref:CHK kinase-like domain-containing protein n=1 Tax=Parthenolecanium corni TaxID=536013 RepID=A0AAN9TDT1_9HEMI
MKLFIENSLKEFVKKRVDIFGIRSEFVGFEYSQTNAEDSTKGWQSENIFGCISYKNENGNILLSPSLVLKSQPTVSFVAEAQLLQYVNEIFVYGHILPFFAHLEPSVLELFPKYYASYTQTYPESSEAVILLENLRDSGYQNAPCKSFLDYAHLSLMVRSLGKFHAFSYLAKELDPLRFQAYALSLNPINGPIIGRFEGLLPTCCSRGLKDLALRSEYKSIIPVIQHLLDNAEQILMALFKNERNNPWAVVCHGDYLSGNVMFKYDKGHPVHLKIFDLATNTFSSPVLDLALVLYMNANQETRDLYWNQLVDDYCDGLSSLPIPVRKLPSRDVVTKELQSKAFYAYIIASFYLNILVAEDLGLGSFHQYLPPEYAHCKNFAELPVKIQVDIDLKSGGEITSQHLGDILKDMLKRGFIHNSSQFNIGYNITS